eukprot:COSAG05_NODE_7989_length_748_cov_1.332820_2_plen_189_part_01
MVDFFAPWCGHCMQLAPEYEKAAQELFLDGFVGVLARVDGSDEVQNQQLMQRYGIDGYPTLLVFMDGIAVDVYSENHAGTSIANYMRQFVAPPPDFYGVLGLDRNAPTAAVKKGYRELSKQLHPDRAEDGHGDPDRFALATLAYETLSDVDKRSMYDAFGGIQFHRKGMQRKWLQHKGIKLKLYAEEGS